MLNELLALERGLSDYGFLSVGRHPDMSQLRKGDVVRVRLAQDGTIADIERLDGKIRPDIWTLRDGKQNGFPGIKTARGLLELDDAAGADHETRWKAARNPAAKRTEIERLFGEAKLDFKADDWPKPGHRDRIAQRLADLRTLEADATTRAVPAAFERFLKALRMRPPFLHRLVDALLAQVRHGDDGWLDLARAALVGAVPLAIDVSRDLARDAGDERQIGPVSQALSNSQGTLGAWSGVCALTGAETKLLEGNFPQPTLPSLGQTYLFSRNTDIRALARYGHNGPASLPVTADLVGRFSGALTTVTEEARKGQTWRLLPAESGDRQDLFLAFVASATEQPVADSFFVGNDDEGEAEDAVRIGLAEVEQAASRLLRFWQGIADKAPPDERARILILRVVDPGNRKAVYDRSPAVAALHNAARVWSQAMRNAPSWIGFTVFIGKKPAQGRVRAQPPLSLVPLSRKLYVRGGREVADAPGLPGSEALALFLGEGDRPRRARRVLRLLLDRHTGLLGGIAHAKRREQLKDFDPKAAARIDALRGVSWLAALLWFLDRTKENYMNDVGFKLGQLLSAVDAVHMGYCLDMRGGDVPPTLIGNSVFASAGRNPVGALDVLQTRWKPYHAWATRAEKRFQGKPADAKGWAIIRALSQARHARTLCRELQPLLSDMRLSSHGPDETFRAELLLGYVAGIEPAKKIANVPSESEEIIE